MKRRLQGLFQAVTTAVLISLAKGRKEAEEGLGSAASVWMRCVLCVFIAYMCCRRHFSDQASEGRAARKKKEKKKEKRREEVWVK